MPISEVFNMDRMEFLSRFKDKEISLVLDDPPYGIDADKKNSSDKIQSKRSAQKSRNYGGQRWDSDIPNVEYFAELFRVSKNQIIWGGPRRQNPRYSRRLYVISDCLR